MNVNAASPGVSMSASPPPTVAIEEHFMHPSLASHFPPAAMHQPPAIRDRLFDFAERRLREMDEAGVGMQVLSHQSPGSQRLDPAVAVEACRAVNDALAAVVRATPDRFAGLAMLPTTAAAGAAADELSRAVEELGLKGAMIHGPSGGRFVDERDFWPIWARAERLRAPVYLHPAMPDRAVTAAYYATYAESHPAFLRSAWGFGVETGTQAVRMVLSGVLEEHPDLQLVLGHLGEGIPFLLARIDESLARPGNAPVRFAEAFRRNFHVTTSGFLSDAALRLCLDELGADRVMLAVDWPYMGNLETMRWIAAAPLRPEERALVLGGNARALLRL